MYIGTQQGTAAPVLLDAIRLNGQAAYTMEGCPSDNASKFEWTDSATTLVTLSMVQPSPLLVRWLLACHRLLVREPTQALSCSC